MLAFTLVSPPTVPCGTLEQCIVTVGNSLADGLIMLGMVLAVILFLVGALQYMMNPGGQEGKTTMQGPLFGVALLVFGAVIVKIILHFVQSTLNIP